MGHMHLQVAVVALDASLRRDVVRVTESAGHRVAVTRTDTASTKTRLAECQVAVVAGNLERDLAAIRQAAPDLPIIAVLPTVNLRAVSMLLREGVAGVVVQSELDETLAPTILAVACGQLCIPLAYAAQAGRPPLSTREKQILGMVVLGFANIEIAQRLVVAESTVKSRLHSAFGKLGVRTRVEAAALILDPANGLGTGILTIPTDSPAQGSSL